LSNNKKILIVPLDWGLGHATRCIPIITELLNAGFEVVVAGNTKTNSIIKDAFPLLIYLQLEGYNISYSSNAFLLPFTLVRQIPSILSKIKYEQKWLQKIIETENIDIVISDNRYGLYAQKITSIFLTHQLTIQVPQSKWIEKLLNKINHSFIKKFTTCWIPDEENNALAGNLSTCTNTAIQKKYIGNLSRFSLSESSIKRNEVLIILSGPEPQRTKLEQLLVAQANEIDNINFVIVRGLVNNTSTLSVKKNITCYNHLAKSDLEKAIQTAEIIISRAGYSSIMDYIKLNKHSILIPTTGQTEQEYLGNFHHQKKWFLCFKQNDFDLKKCITTYQNTSFNPFDMSNASLLKKAISTL
jgi:uncharacterized protein (TIGR00661 family)